MKHSILILATLAMLMALPATNAWSQSSKRKQCMEECLAPAIESGDPDVINAAIRKCAAQCSPPLDNVGANAAAGALGMSLGGCLSTCYSKNRNCLNTVRDPLKCNIQFEYCRNACYR